MAVGGQLGSAQLFCTEITIWGLWNVFSWGNWEKIVFSTAVKTRWDSRWPWMIRALLRDTFIGMMVFVLVCPRLLPFIKPFFFPCESVWTLPREAPSLQAQIQADETKPKDVVMVSVFTLLWDKTKRIKEQNRPKFKVTKRVYSHTLKEWKEKIGERWNKLWGVWGGAEGRDGFVPKPPHFWGTDLNSPSEAKLKWNLQTNITEAWFFLTEATRRCDL